MGMEGGWGQGRDRAGTGHPHSTAVPRGSDLHIPARAPPSASPFRSPQMLGAQSLGGREGAEPLSRGGCSCRQTGQGEPPQLMLIALPQCLAPLNPHRYHNSGGRGGTQCLSGGGGRTQHADPDPHSIVPHNYGFSGRGRGSNRVTTRCPLSVAYTQSLTPRFGGTRGGGTPPILCLTTIAHSDKASLD